MSQHIQSSVVEWQCHRPADQPSWILGSCPGSCTESTVSQGELPFLLRSSSTSPTISQKGAAAQANLYHTVSTLRNMFADFTVQWRRMRETYSAELACLLVILTALLVLVYVDLSDSCLHKLQSNHNRSVQHCAAGEALMWSHRSNWSIAASLGTEWCQPQAGKPERTKRDEDAMRLQREDQNHAESKVATCCHCSML